MEVRFSMNGEPRGKGSVRCACKGKGKKVFGQPYKAAVDREYENSMRGLARQAMGNRPPMVGPLEASFRFRLPIPKSTTKKQRAKWLSGEEAFLGHFDVSNMVKAVEDSMNTVVYVDDTQIVRYGTVEKIAHETPGIDVLIVALSPQPMPEHTLTNRPEGVLAPQPERSASVDRRRLAGGPSEKPAQIVSTQGCASGTVGHDPECAVAATYYDD